MSFKRDEDVMLNLCFQRDEDSQQKQDCARNCNPHWILVVHNTIKIVNIPIQLRMYGVTSKLDTCAWLKSQWAIRVACSDPIMT